MTEQDLIPKLQALCEKWRGLQRVIWAREREEQDELTLNWLRGMSHELFNCIDDVRALIAELKPISTSSTRPNGHN